MIPNLGIVICITIDITRITLVLALKKRERKRVGPRDDWIKIDIHNYTKMMLSDIPKRSIVLRVNYHSSKREHLEH